MGTITVETAAAYAELYGHDALQRLLASDSECGESMNSVIAAQIAGIEAFLSQNPIHLAEKVTELPVAA